MSIDFQLNRFIAVLTLAGLYFAYFQWKSYKAIKRINILKTLKKQLECLGPWMSMDNNGYVGKPKPQELFDNLNPYKWICNTASDLLAQINLIDGLDNIPEKILGEINQLHYDLIRIRDISEYRTDIINSIPEVSLAMNLFWVRASKKNEPKDKLAKLDNLIESVRNKEFRKKLKKQRQLLAGLFELTHYYIIGNNIKKDAQNARLHHERISKWVDQEIYASRWYLNFEFILIHIFLFFAFANLLFYYYKFDQNFINFIFCPIYLFCSGVFYWLTFKFS